MTISMKHKTKKFSLNEGARDVSIEEQRTLKVILMFRVLHTL